jgi:hypothetical protein
MNAPRELPAATAPPLHRIALAQLAPAPAEPASGPAAAWLARLAQGLPAAPIAMWQAARVIAWLQAPVACARPTLRLFDRLGDSLGVPETLAALLGGQALSTGLLRVDDDATRPMPERARQMPLSLALALRRRQSEWPGTRRLAIAVDVAPTLPSAARAAAGLCEGVAGGARRPSLRGPSRRGAARPPRPVARRDWTRRQLRTRRRTRRELDDALAQDCGARLLWRAHLGSDDAAELARTHGHDALPVAQLARAARRKSQVASRKSQVDASLPQAARQAAREGDSGEPGSLAQLMRDPVGDVALVAPP